MVTSEFGSFALIVHITALSQSKNNIKATKVTHASRLGAYFEKTGNSYVATVAKKIDIPAMLDSTPTENASDEGPVVRNVESPFPSTSRTKIPHGIRIIHNTALFCNWYSFAILGTRLFQARFPLTFETAEKVVKK